MSTTEVKIIEQLLEIIKEKDATIKEKDATIKEFKDEVKRLSGNLNIYAGISGSIGLGYVATNPEGKIKIEA